MHRSAIGSPERRSRKTREGGNFPRGLKEIRADRGRDFQEKTTRGSFRVSSAGKFRILVPPIPPPVASS